MENFASSDSYLRTGDRVIRSFPLVDIDEVSLPGTVFPYTSSSVNGYSVSEDLFSFLSSIPDTDCVIYNQLLQVPAQRILLQKLQGKAKKHASLPDASNKIAYADIEKVLNKLAVDSNLLVYCNFNIIVSCSQPKITSVGSYIENKLFSIGIMPSKAAYNQLELFTASFPGNAFKMNSEYDLFLTLGEAALCFCFKEHLKTDEQTPLTTYYTDRQGLPVCIDITGKEGKVKMTDNANFFCIGPSGSGKSFHMNSVVRQLLEQNTDVVMVDTGDSYEGICGYFNGIYISYSKEKPISMNPFRITDIEYNQNFGEKKNFLKSLIFLMFKGNEVPSKIEDMVINQIIVEYYDAYFHPFHGFSNSERDDLRRKLIVSSKMDEDYNTIESKLDDIETQINSAEESDSGLKPETRALLRPAEERRIRLIRQCRTLNKIINDEAASLPERQTAMDKLEDYKKELNESHMLIKIDKQIDIIESQRKRLKVPELSFNSFYEFSLERIPQILTLEKIEFDIRGFCRDIKNSFYRGGELETTLNSDLDVNLFDEKFIVFEIDKIKGLKHKS